MAGGAVITFHESDWVHCHKCNHRTEWSPMRGGKRLKCTGCGDVFPCRHSCDHVDCMDAKQIAPAADYDNAEGKGLASLPAPAVVRKPKRDPVEGVCIECGGPTDDLDVCETCYERMVT